MKSKTIAQFLNTLKINIFSGIWYILLLHLELNCFLYTPFYNFVDTPWRMIYVRYKIELVWAFISGMIIGHGFESKYIECDGTFNIRIVKVACGLVDKIIGSFSNLIWYMYLAIFHWNITVKLKHIKVYVNIYHKELV